MRRRDAMLLRTALVILCAGCARHSGAPPIQVGASCAACGMEVHDLRFACERPASGTWRVYDAIECLIRDTGTPEAARGAWLADYDRRTLHPIEDLWVVRGSFPSPMGGGYAAFLSRPAADSVAVATNGHVERLATWLTASGAAR